MEKEESNIQTWATMTTCLPLNFFSSSRTRRVFEKIEGKVLIRKSPEVNENTTIKFSNDSFHQNL